MKIVYMGTPDFAVNPLHALAEAGYEVTGVVTQPDKPKGRGKSMLPTPVKEEALKHGFPVYQPVKVRDPEFLQVLEKLDPDIIVVAAFGQIIPKSILELPKYGCINIHASLLPKYRGAAPIQQAVIDGEKESGVTIMRMGTGLDTGDMILKTEIPIAEDETGESLHDKLAEAGAALCVKTLHAIENKTAVFEKQPESPTAYAKMLTKDLGNIDWAKSAVQIERLVRGLNSWPSAYTHRDGKVMKIWKALAKPQEECAEQTELGSEEHTAQKTGKNAMPGTVVSVAKDSFCIQTGDGVLRILEVQMPGKKRMDTGSFLRGYKVEEGMVFGRE